MIVHIISCATPGHGTEGNLTSVEDPQEREGCHETSRSDFCSVVWRAGVENKPAAEEREFKGSMNRVLPEYWRVLRANGDEPSQHYACVRHRRHQDGAGRL